MQFMWQTPKNLSRLCFAKILAHSISESTLSIVLSVFYFIFLEQYFSWYELACSRIQTWKLSEKYYPIATWAIGG